MLLAIDTGNTNVKFALVDDSGEIIKRWRIATDARRTADEYAVWLDQLIQMAGFRRTDITAVIIATVVPRALHNLQLLASHYFDCEALIAGRGSRRVGNSTQGGRAAIGRCRPCGQRHCCAIDGGGRQDRHQLRHRNHISIISAPMVPIAAAASRPGSTCRSTRFMPPPPCCRALPSNRRPMTA